MSNNKGRTGDMPTTATPAEEASNTGSTDDTSGQEQQQEQQENQAPTGDKPGNGEQKPAEATVTKDTKLPDDHPVVKQLAADKAKLAKANTELAELRAKSATVTQLEEELAKRPTPEALATLQTRNDRLEAFLQAAGGPLARALDSRTFTRDLFETDKDIAEIVKEWHKANPTATSSALSSAAAGQGQSTKHDPNALLRAAIGKG